MNPLTDLPLIFNRELGKNTGMFLDPRLSRSTFNGKPKYPGKVGFPSKCCMLYGWCASQVCFIFSI